MRGHDRLWGWFGLSYASWLTIPRVLMHAMPDDWQDRMAQLLCEFDETFPGKDAFPTPHVSAREGTRFTRWPEWLLRYRHPDTAAIDALRPRAAREVAR